MATGRLRVFVRVVRDTCLAPIFDIRTFQLLWGTHVLQLVPYLFGSNQSQRPASSDANMPSSSAASILRPMATIRVDLCRSPHTSRHLISVHRPTAWRLCLYCGAASFQKIPLQRNTDAGTLRRTISLRISAHWSVSLEFSHLPVVMLRLTLTGESRLSMMPDSVSCPFRDRDRYGQHRPCVSYHLLVREKKRI